MNIIFPDCESKRRGCDILVEINGSYVLIEVKSCNLNMDDFNKAFEQFNTTISDYKINNESMRKIILHQGKRCNTFSNFMTFCKKKGIMVIYEDDKRLRNERNGNNNPTSTTNIDKNLYNVIRNAYTEWKSKRKSKQV
ncbi:MAG: hypothetical protein QXS98_04000 [Candidatus Nitrosocaldus sp.]